MSDVPDWISASAALVALALAGLAARWTAKTASAAAEQVEAAKAQVEAANAQVKLAEEAAERQQQRTVAAEAHADRAEAREREQIEAAEERFQKVQLDARAPAVYFRVKSGHDGSVVIGRDSRIFGWSPPLAMFSDAERATLRDVYVGRGANEVRELTEVSSSETYFFVITATIECINVSDFPARVDIVDPAGLDFHGDFDSNFFVVAPGEHRYFLGKRYVNSHELKGRLQGFVEFERAMPRVKFWVRDLGMNTIDVHLLSLDFRFFEADGSRLIAHPETVFAWSEVADQIPPRIYDRLEAAKNASGAD